MPGRAFGTATNALHRRCSGRVRRGARRRARGGARAVVAPAPRPVGPPGRFRPGCPNPPRCARLPRGRSSLAAGPGRARLPGAFFATAAPACRPLRRGPSGPWAGAPAPAGAACPPMACRPSRSPFDCGLPRGGSALLSPPGPPGCAPRPRAPPVCGGARGRGWGLPGPPFSRLRSLRGGRARPVGRACWARCAPRGEGERAFWPPRRAAKAYRRKSRLLHPRSGERPRRERLLPVLELVPCAPSFAIVD